MCSTAGQPSDIRFNPSKNTSATPGTVDENYFRFAAGWKMIEIHLANLKQWKSIVNTPAASAGTALEHHFTISCMMPPTSKIGNRTNLYQPDSDNLSLNNVDDSIDINNITQ